jgi:hypothetical protein
LVSEGGALGGVLLTSILPDVTAVIFSPSKLS